ncbi:MAG TPA: hypothetical protein VK631_10535 [Solirubrobacteraceae bacterium]|nr:hypothetical protein [Solirubrobacteraceae bacterium]
MSYERPGRSADLIADAVLVHGLPHEQSGMSGIVIKQDEPKLLDSLLARTQVQVGVKYVLRLKGRTRQKLTDHAGLAGATLGAAVYINGTTDALVLVDGATTVPFGRVVALAGTFGVQTGYIEIDMDLKDAVLNSTP